MLAKRRREARADGAAPSRGGGGARKAAAAAAEEEHDDDEEQQREKEQREKIATMLSDSLLLARREMLQQAAGEDGGDGSHVPDEAHARELGTSIEAAVFDTHGKALTKEYKNRMRSLQFNLKDASNPGLRARVLLGELPPHRLASMAAEELASKQLAEWRQRKAQEAVKAVIMDSDPEFDKLGRRLRKTHKGEEVVDIGGGAGGGVPGGAVVLPDIVPPTQDGSPQHAAVHTHMTLDPGHGDAITLADGDDAFSPRGVASPSAGADIGHSALSFEAFAASRHDSDTVHGAAPPAPSAGDADGSSAAVKVHMPAMALKVVALSSSAPAPRKPVSTPTHASAKHHGASASAKAAAAAGNATPSHASASAAGTHNADGAAPTGVAQASGPAEWSGVFVVSSVPTVSVRVTAHPIGGEQAPLGGGVLPAQVHVKGRTHMSEVEKYVLHHIQRGKSTTKALTLAVCRPDAAQDQQQVDVLCDGYSQRGRAGLAQTSSGVEVYLLPPRCKLAAKLLGSEGLPPMDSAGPGEILLALVHRKGLGAAHPKLLPLPTSPTDGNGGGGGEYDDDDGLPDVDASAAASLAGRGKASGELPPPPALGPPGGGVDPQGPDIQASFKSLADILLPPSGVGAPPPGGVPVISSTLLQTLLSSSTAAPMGMPPGPPPRGGAPDDLPEWTFRGGAPPGAMMAPQHHLGGGGLMAHQQPMGGFPSGPPPPPGGGMPFIQGMPGLHGGAIRPPRPPPGMPPRGGPTQMGGNGMQPQMQWMSAPPGGMLPQQQQLPSMGMPPPPPGQMRPGGFFMGPQGAPVPIMPGLPPPRPPPGLPPGPTPQQHGQQGQRYDPRLQR